MASAVWASCGPSTQLSASSLTKGASQQVSASMSSNNCMCSGLQRSSMSFAATRQNARSFCTKRTATVQQFSSVQKFSHPVKLGWCNKNAVQRVTRQPMLCQCAAVDGQVSTTSDISYSTSRLNDGSATAFAPLLNGCWSLQGSSADILQTMSQHAEAGLSTFDTADIYGRSETYLGEFSEAWARKRGDSQLPEIQVFTKFVPDIFRNRVTPQFVEAAIKKSLAALRTPKLDLVQLHWWDYQVPGLLDAAKCLAELQSRGLITSIGLTNMNTETLAAVVDAGVSVVSNQVQFSLLDRRPQKEMLTYAKEKDIKIFTYGTLAGGLLSDRYNEPGEKDLLGRVRYEPVSLSNNSLKMYWPNVGSFGGQPRWRALLELLSSVAQKHDVSTANVALRWAMDQGPVYPIVGMRSAAHIEDNLRILRLQLDADDLSKLDGFLEESGTRPGDCYDQERGN